MTDELKSKITSIIKEGMNNGMLSSKEITEKIAEVVDSAIVKAVLEGTNMKEIFDAFDLEIRSIK